MKKYILFFGLALCSGVTVLHAQSKVDKAGHAIKKGAKKAGNKTAEVASKGASKVADKTYKDKVGPDGQTIYIDGHSKYYWVDGKGHHIYVTEAELKNKD